MLRRIALIKVAQQVGISLQQIQITLAQLPQDRVAAMPNAHFKADMFQSLLRSQTEQMAQALQAVDQTNSKSEV